MASTVTVDQKNSSSRVRRVEFDYNTDTGAASATTTLEYGGIVGRVILKPDGTNPPQTGHVVKLRDREGVDFFNVTPASGSTTYDYGPNDTALRGGVAISRSTVTVDISNAGTGTRNGKVIAFVV